MPNQKSKIFRRPVVWFSASVIFYLVFELTNATVTCRSLKIGALVGLFSFLGFWSLFGAVVTSIIEIKENKKFSWWILAIIALIIALTLADWLFGKTCHF